MPIRHAVDAEAGLLHIELSGAITSGDIYALAAEVQRDPRLRSDLGVLADCREVSGVPGFDELSAIAYAQSSLVSSRRPVRAAVVVSWGWMFGVARQFAALVEPAGLRIVPFYDIAAARRWLVASSGVDRSADRPAWDSDLRA